MKIIITKETQNQRVDIALSSLSEFSRSMIQKIIYAKKLTCNGLIIEKPNHITKPNEEYDLTPIQSNFSDITPEQYDLDILFEDEYLIVINKPAELIVHPGAGNYNNTLINKLAYHCKLSNLAGPERLGTVHRLDKGVSGCIIFAKDNFTHAALNEQFAKKTIKKQYIAISHCNNFISECFAEDFIERSKTDRQKMAISNNGKLSQMHFKIIKLFTFQEKKLALIQCNPITGRMHQIRLQLSHRKLPILNDPKYGHKEIKEIKELLKTRIALHSNKIEFFHPKTNKNLTILANLPTVFEQILTKI